jgi:hypothetical protein
MVFPGTFRSGKAHRLIVAIAVCVPFRQKNAQRACVQRFVPRRQHFLLHVLNSGAKKDAAVYWRPVCLSKGTLHRLLVQVQRCFARVR